MTSLGAGEDLEIVLSARDEATPVIQNARAEVQGLGQDGAQAGVVAGEGFERMGSATRSVSTGARGLSFIFREVGLTGAASAFQTVAAMAHVVHALDEVKRAGRDVTGFFDAAGATSRALGTATSTATVKVDAAAMTSAAVMNEAASVEMTASAGAQNAAASTMAAAAATQEAAASEMATAAAAQQASVAGGSARAALGAGALAGGGASLALPIIGGLALGAVIGTLIGESIRNSREARVTNHNTFNIPTTVHDAGHLNVDTLADDIARKVEGRVPTQSRVPTF